jgi:hypothetical protein
VNRSIARSLPFVLAALVATLFPTRASDDIRTERVRFKPGTTSTAIEGSIKGYATVDYLVGARDGQQMNVSLATKHTATYFNILAPGENEVAMFNGSTSENQYEGTLPKSGDYRIRVYMMRSAARREEVANYRLEIIVNGGGAQSSGPEGDAKVAGTDFHATGEIPCSMGGDQPTRSCPFGVTRRGGGSGTVTVTRPDGRKRQIYFEKGLATGCDRSQADSGEFRTSRQDDLTIVQIGGERYEFPDAVINGG